jgi:hypothetical protein
LDLLDLLLRPVDDPLNRGRGLRREPGEKRAEDGLLAPEDRPEVGRQDGVPVGRRGRLVRRGLVRVQGRLDRADVPAGRGASRIVETGL